MDRAWRLSVEQVVPGVEGIIVECRDSAQKRSGIRMTGIFEQGCITGNLNKSSKVHDSYAMTNLTDQRQIV